ncbi:MAG: ABC transporter permease [Acidobacteriota bacterium]
MNLLRRIREIWSRFGRRPGDEDLDEEIRAHLQIEIDERIESGMAPEQAHYAAQRKFGNVAMFREMTREVWHFGWWDHICQDVRIAARMLAKSRSFTFAAVLTLAIGIGSTTSIFSVVHAVLYPEYSFSDPGRVVYVSSINLKRDQDTRAPSLVSFSDWRQRSDVFQELTAYRNTAVAWIDEGEPERIVGMTATANIFRMAGVQPLLGRDFDAGADRPGKANVVILGYGFWQSRLGGAQNVIGRNVLINNRPCSVIGVMPAGKGFPSAEVKYWVPWVVDEDPLRSSTMPGGGFSVVGRLKPGVSPAQAQAVMNGLEARLGQSDRNRKMFGVRLRAMTDTVSPLSKTTVVTLFGAVLFVLLVACVNVAGLLLARASVRSREMALRSALGASRTRIVRHLLTECALLSLLGGVAGTVLAYWEVRLFLALKAPGIPGPSAARLDPAVLLFAIGSSVLTALLFGLLPSFHAAQTDLTPTLKQGVGPLTRRTANRKRAALVVIEMALALVLLAGAGLMMNSFVKLQNVELGFNPQNVIAFRVTVPGAEAHKSSVPARVQFVDELLRRLQALPQVQAAAASSIFPLDGSGAFTSAKISGAASDQGHWFAIEPVGVTDGYFQTMGIPMLRGRTFSDRDVPSAAPVAILSQEAAQKLDPGTDPIGMRLSLAGETVSREVIGVAGNVRYGGLQTQFGPKVYVPAASDWIMSYVTFVVRTAGDPRNLVPSLRREVWAVDPKMPIEIETLKDLFEPHIATPRFYLGLFGFFAFVAVLMAAVGLYGLINYSVEQRTQEFGIRMALGAEAGDVLGMVIREGIWIALAGAGLGLAGALWLTRFIKSFLFGVTPTDGTTLGIVSAVLILVAILACLIPARRASRIEPSVALKYE